MRHSKMLQLAINKLGIEFVRLDLTFHKMIGGKADDLTSYWPGNDEEDVMVCVFQGKEIHEPFHRQDFFFINYAYKNSYEALSAKFDNLIVIHEDECYIGQPYSGYALRGKNDDELIIFGVLIQRDAFFREYLPIIYANASLFRFFIEPRTNRFSDEYIHLTLPKDNAIRTILELMVMEYADRTEDTQLVLKSLLHTLFTFISRRYRLSEVGGAAKSIAEKIIDYMDSHSNEVTLKNIAEHFSYHPNYISALLHKENGRKFTEILLEKRMERAALLLRNTTLSIEEISALLGYSNHSNFFKAFKDYYGKTPRDFMKS